MILNCSQEMESSDVIPDWVETSQANDVLVHAGQFPSALSSATINDVSIIYMVIVKCSPMGIILWLVYCIHYSLALLCNIERGYKDERVHL